AKVMTNDGYFRSGDVGILLPSGMFKIVDRLKDMILVSGFNVYPNEVEDVIASHPGVLEVAVIGVPDEHSGEAVAAYIVKREADVDVESIKVFARESLTAYKVPKHIHFRETLPKTPVGKVLRRMLREEVSA
ncbi:MAG: AMP-binding enzyme, partial [Rhabdaerophilum sp.]